MFVLKNGDLLFFRKDSNQLSKAIVNSTSHNKAIQYDHVAIIIYNGKIPYVYEACPKYGVRKTSFINFTKDINSNIDLYRLKTTFNTQKLYKEAESYLGLSYNHSFSPDEPGFYCADFIYESFEHRFFHLIPMQFGPNHTIDNYWKKYYRKIGKKIPLNKPGLNPNDMIKQGSLNLIKANFMIEKVD